MRILRELAVVLGGGRRLISVDRALVPPRDARADIHVHKVMSEHFRARGNLLGGLLVKRGKFTSVTDGTFFARVPMRFPVSNTARRPLGIMAFL